MAGKCHCAAYDFPHRPGGGDCDGLPYICGECGLSCNMVERTEMLYMPYGDRNPNIERVYQASECCNAPVMEARG